MKNLKGPEDILKSTQDPQVCILERKLNLYEPEDKRSLAQNPLGK